MEPGWTALRPGWVKLPVSALGLKVTEQQPGAGLAAAFNRESTLMHRRGAFLQAFFTAKNCPALRATVTAS